MANKYDYILYKADGQKIVLGRGVAKMKWEEIKDAIGADLLEMVPKEYIDPELDEDIDKSKCGWFYMDEEARLKESTNIRNPFFHVIRIEKERCEQTKAIADALGIAIISTPMPINNGYQEWDIVGDVVMEKKV
jgi:hypothetical protein